MVYVSINGLVSMQFGGEEAFWWQHVFENLFTLLFCFWKNVMFYIISIGTDSEGYWCEKVINWTWVISSYIFSSLFIVRNFLHVLPFGARFFFLVGLVFSVKKKGDEGFG